MNCENLFCIYQKDNQCILDEIDLDITGMCTSCIYINIDNESLEKSKNELLNKYRTK